MKPLRPTIRYRPGTRRPMTAPKGQATGSKHHSGDVFSIVDDWPALVPVTAAEIAVIETYFPTILDDFVAAAQRKRAKAMDEPA